MNANEASQQSSVTSFYASQPRNDSGTVISEKLTFCGFSF